MINNKTFFIISTGTEIGKTYVAANIIKNFNKIKKKILPLKPILSGFEPKYFYRCDTAKLLKANNSVVTIQKIRHHTPWLFKRPLAPILAAQYENKYISYKEVLEWINHKNQERKNKDEYTLIEGAGGLMVPIEHKKTFLDLIKDLKVPVVLVIGNYLGTLSHTLSVIKNLDTMGINIICIALNQLNKNETSIKDTELCLKRSMTKKISIHKILYNNSNLSSIAKEIYDYF